MGALIALMIGSVVGLSVVTAMQGFVAVRATVGEISWDTSLLPVGDGTQCIALPAKVRRANELVVGGSVMVSFVSR